MIDTTSLLLTNPDFENLRGSLVNFLKSQDRFKDIDYDGSNISVVLDVLAYNTYQNAFLTNMVATEMFLDTAQLRSSLISHAKELGYVPRSARSSIAKIEVEIVPGDNPGSIIIPKHTLFSTTIGNQSYTFMTDQAHTVSLNDSKYVKDIYIYEGFIVEERVVLSGEPSEKFTLSNKSVDTSSIEVFASTGGEEEQLKLATSIVGLNSTSSVFFLQQNSNEHYEIVFGDGISGKLLPHNTLVRVSYRITDADLANGAYQFAPIAPISGYSNIKIATQAVASGGASPESDESIRTYAPLLNQTRGRAFSADDYKVILSQAYPEIQAINVFGGEELTPPQYGKVIISIDIAGTDGIPDTKKAQYYNALKAVNPTTIEPIFINPSFIYLKINSEVSFDYTQTNLTIDDIKAKVIDSIMAFNGKYLNGFDITFQSSKFGTAIDDSHPSINGNDTSIQMVGEVDLDLSRITSYVIKFANEIDNSAPGAISSSLFKYSNKICTIYDENGTLYIVPSNSTETKIIQIGSVDYENGTVTLLPFTPDAVYNGVFKIYMKPKSGELTAKMNNILAINLNDVTVNVTAKRK